VLRASRPPARDRCRLNEQQPSNAAIAVIGTAIAVYAVFDSLIVGLPTLVLAATYDSLRVFAVAALAIVLLNVACCTWIDEHWGEWVAGSGARVETRLRKMRDKKSLEKPVSWIEQGTAARYALAAAIVNAILVVGSARIFTGRPVGSHRIRVASLSYGLIFAGVYSLCGYMLGRLIAAL
jgi:hypothetical protein